MGNYYAQNFPQVVHFVYHVERKSSLTHVLNSMTTPSSFSFVWIVLYLYCVLNVITHDTCTFIDDTCFKILAFM